MRSRAGAPFTRVSRSARRSRPSTAAPSPWSSADPRGRAAAILAKAEKVRQLGSAALNLCHTATGGVALQLTPAPVRAFDLAGPLLILREAGGMATDFDGRPVDAVSVRLDSRTTLLASLSSTIHAFALQLLGTRVA